MNSASSSKPPRVGILSIHPAPYRDATFVALCQRGVVDIKVLTLSHQDPNHPHWDLDGIAYPNVTLKCWRNPIRCFEFHPQIYSLFKKERFDVIVIPVSYYATCRFAIIYCLVTRTPFILTEDKMRRPHDTSILRKVRRAIVVKPVRYIQRSASACWVPGKASRQYLRDEGVEDSRIFEGCYNLDYATIAAQVECQKGERSQWRRSLSIDEDGFVFLMVANVNSDRQHDLLLESFSRVVAACPNSYLLLVGKDANQEAIMRQSKGKEIEKIENIRSVGPVAFGALPPLFVASDAYVHSGFESYSTAVAYAAIAGLPIVTTPHVGAARDHVIEGETGFLVDSEDVSGFADKMLLLARDKTTAQRFGRKAGELLSKFTSEWAAEQLEKTVAVAYRPKKKAMKSHRDHSEQSCV